MKASACRRATVGWIAVAVVTACTTGGDSGSGSITRDTVITHAGVDVTVSIVENAAIAAELPVWTVSPDPVVDLGGANVPEDEALFRVTSAVRLSDGRIVVGDGGSRSLKVFDESGALTGSIGGPGEGPGEFRGINLLALRPGDSLAVWDFNQGRLTTFDDAGAIGRETRIGAGQNSPMSSVIGIFGDGSLLAQDFIRLAEPPNGLLRNEIGGFHLAMNGALLDSVPPFRTGEVWFVSLNNGFSAYTPPFARSTRIIAHDDRIIIGDTENPEVRILAPDGTPRSVIRWQDERRRITGPMVERARLESLGDDPAENTRTNVERMYAAFEMPDVTPAFGDVRVDVDGNVWVQAYRSVWEEGDITWSVFDRGGDRIATVSMPGAFTPTHIGHDFVLGTATDELDVEHVRLHHLDRN